MNNPQPQPQPHDAGGLHDWFAQNLVEEKGVDGARAATAQANGHVRAAIERAIAVRKVHRPPNGCTEEFNNAALALGQEQNASIPDDALPVTFMSTVEMVPPPLGSAAARPWPTKGDDAGFLKLPGTLQAVGFGMWSGTAFEAERWYALIDSMDLPHPTGRSVWGDADDQYADDADDGGDA